MSKKLYIRPFAEFCLQEMDSEMLAGSPNNGADVALPDDGENPMKGDVNDKVKDPTDPDSPPPVDAKKNGIFFNSEW